MPAIQHSIGFADVAQNFAASLRRGVSPWRRLSEELSLMPIAGTTGKSFRGINRWVLANKGFSDPCFFPGHHLDREKSGQCF
jgi:antirestriction protein ArdC